MDNQFSKYKINDNIIKSLNDINVTEPTPIQDKTIPILISGDDCIGQAQTGTGKTYAYLIPLLNSINYNSKNIEALVLTPTRELSIQVNNELKKLITYLPKVSSANIYGGESYDKQYKELKNKPQIIIGTPGRIIDQINKGNINFSNIKYLVLDEADEMLKMGFQEDLETILQTIPNKHQTALFSATLPSFIKNISKSYMNNPKIVKIESKTLTVENILENIYYCKNNQKLDLLIRLLDYYNFNSVMIFSNTKSMVDEIVLYLKSNNYLAEGLHGDLKQKERDKVMTNFRNSYTKILVATDVAARGIDIDGIDGIINYDLPNENEIYVHRIGRTARNGANGIALSIVCKNQIDRVFEIEKYINHKINKCDIPTVKEINRKKLKNLYNDIISNIDLNKDNTKYDNLILKLSNYTTDPIPIIKTLLCMIDVNNKEYKDIDTIDLSKYKNINTNFDEKTMFELNLGKNDNIRPNELVSYLHDEMKIHRENIGKIKIYNNKTLLEINKTSMKYLKNINNKRLKGKKIKLNEIRKMPK